MAACKMLPRHCGLALRRKSAEHDPMHAEDAPVPDDAKVLGVDGTA